MAKRATKKTEESEIVAAVRFASLAQQAEGSTNQVHCRLTGSQIIAYDGILATGTALESGEIQICPNTIQFLRALERAKDKYSLTLLDDGNIVVTTSKFRAIIQCVGANDLPWIGPDPKQWPLSDNFRIAAEAAGIFTAEGATAVQYAALTTLDGSIVGTNGRVLIEAYHGIPTPPGLIIPKQFFIALNKVQKPLAGFGFTETSFTVHFEDDSWIRTQLYVNERPLPIDTMIGWLNTARRSELPKEFFTAIEAVAPFSPEGRFYIGNDAITSHANDEQGASFKLKGIEPSGSYLAAFFMKLKPHMHTVDLHSNDKVAVFYGNPEDTVKVRGIISKSYS